MNFWKYCREVRADCWFLILDIQFNVIRSIIFFKKNYSWIYDFFLCLRCKKFRFKNNILNSSSIWILVYISFMSIDIIRVFSFNENLFLNKLCYMFSIERICQSIYSSNFVFNKLRQFLNQGFKRLNKPSYN